MLMIPAKSVLGQLFVPDPCLILGAQVNFEDEITKYTTDEVGSAQALW